jgi:uncharacterized protein (TIGR02145 family)
MSIQNLSAQKLSKQNSLRTHNDLSPQSDLSATKAVRLSCFLPLLLLALLPVTLSAQITGRVLDSEGNALVGVQISALHNGAETQSDADGDFSLTLLENPVGALAHPAQRSAAPGMSGVRLQRNPENWKIEVHSKSGVFDLQGRLLRGVERAGDSYSAEAQPALRKALETPEILVFVKDGSVIKRLEIADDEVDLGDVVAEDIQEGYLCADIVLDANQMCDPRDGNIYRTTTIGTQIWMAENLNFGTYVVDGGGTNQADATIANAHKYCYDDNEANCTLFGGLYQWHSAMALPYECNSTDAGMGSCIVNTPHRGICPEGWHVPTEEEWVTLEDWVNSANVVDNVYAGTSLKSTNLWSSGAGTDAYGWSGLPGGARYKGGFIYQGDYGYWWSASEGDANNAWNRYLRHGVLYATLYGSKYYLKDLGFSLRCLQDDDEYTLNFDSDGGSAIDPLSLEVGALITPPANPVKSGNVFIAWSPALPATMPSAHLTVTAQWRFVVVAGTLTDARDGKEYLTTTIGTQTWMAENLKYETASGSYCYNDDLANCNIYGRLYTWGAAMGGASSSSNVPSGVQGVCPEGWHLPSDAEWTILSDYVIANSAGTSTGNIGPFMKSTTGWNAGSGITSYDTFIFSALPGGIRNNDGSYGNVGSLGVWWSSTESYGSYVNSWLLRYDFDYFARNISDKDKAFAYSVRCLMN